MKIGAFADTHCMHERLLFDWSTIDMLIFAGDAANSKQSIPNEQELQSFIAWFEWIPVKHKIWIAGNHDGSIERKLVRPKDICKSSIYLEHESVTIEGINIFGSPYTPSFNDWAFNVARHKLSRHWEAIPTNTDILITHGPPKGILDLNENKSRVVEQCGDSALLKAVMKKRPKLHIFGHIHDHKSYMNHGILICDNITFINASCVEDGRFDKGLTSGIKTIEI